MSEQELEQLVSAAVRAVLAELRGGTAPPPPSGPLVRVLVGDTDLGLDFALASLKALAGERLRLEYAVTTGDRAQVTLAHLREAGGATAVHLAEQVGCPRAWAAGADAVAVAALDRPTAVRAALTLPESFGSKFLLEALRLGRPTVVAIDGLELEAPAATPQFRHAWAEPAARLEAFGAECVAAVDLGPALWRMISGPSWHHPAENRPLIAAEDVEAADGELWVAPGAVITPLALDRARELGVRLRRGPS